MLSNLSCKIEIFRPVSLPSLLFSFRSLCPRAWAKWAWRQNHEYNASFSIKVESEYLGEKLFKVTNKRYAYAAYSRIWRACRGGKTAWKNKGSRRNLDERRRGKGNREKERFLRMGFHRAKNITVNIAHEHACAVFECFFFFFLGGEARNTRAIKLHGKTLT